jgi:DNA repair exonuclease SbcCD ATPase subunit
MAGLAYELNLLDRENFQEFFGKCDSLSKENIQVCFAYYIKKSKSEVNNFTKQPQVSELRHDWNYESNSTFAFSSINTRDIPNQDFIREFLPRTPMPRSPSSLCEETGVFQKQIDFLIQQHIDSETQRSELTDAQTKSQEEISALKDKNQSLLNSLIKYNRKKDSLKRENTKLNQLLADQKKTIGSLQGLSADFGKLQKAHESTSDELQLQNEKNSSLRESLSKKYEMLDLKAREIEKLGDQLNLLRINNGTLRKDFGAQSAKCLTVSQELSLTYEKFKGADSKFKEFESLEAQLKATISQLTESNTKLGIKKIDQAKIRPDSGGPSQNIT